jgi:hypothetical protein
VLGVSNQVYNNWRDSRDELRRLLDRDQTYAPNPAGIAVAIHESARLLATGIMYAADTWAREKEKDRLVRKDFDDGS